MVCPLNPGCFNDRTSHTLYPVPKLWLAYPANNGDSWNFVETDSSGADTTFMFMESTSSPMYSPLVSWSVSGLRFYDCHVYKQVTGMSTSYYYYNDSVGCVGYLNYLNGKLRKSYILTSFNDRTYMD